MPEIEEARWAARLREQYKNGTNLSARMRLHARFSTNPYGFFRWVFDRYTFPAQARVLELGTGTAQLWKSNADRIPSGWRVVLSDFSDGILREGRAGLTSIAGQFDAACADAQALPFSDKCFDAVIANFMLYHVRDIPRALSEVRRVLRPGCSLYSATMGRENLKEFTTMVRRFIPESRMSGAAERFGLETGYEYFRAAFARVTIERMPDALMVTEAQPLMDYIDSMSSMRRVGTDAQKIALRNYIETELASAGAIRMTKDNGLLVGSI